MIKNAMIIPFLYPYFFIMTPEGTPKTTKDKKVAVITRYDIAMDILNASFTNGTKNAFIPRAKPRTANIDPIIIIGTIRVFLVFVIVSNC